MNLKYDFDTLKNKLKLKSILKMRSLVIFQSPIFHYRTTKNQSEKYISEHNWAWFNKFCSLVGVVEAWKDIFFCINWCEIMGRRFSTYVLNEPAACLHLLLSSFCTTGPAVRHDYCWKGHIYASPTFHVTTLAEKEEYFTLYPSFLVTVHLNPLDIYAVQFISNPI